mmetsp:Transcript_35949/g.99020  ORF Transcript_35949/g.99020 Transcript_35949/m.99020 type:complete len:319 (+) Transcript_35949:129-1085(+)
MKAADSRRSRPQVDPKLKRFRSTRRAVCPHDDDSATLELAGVVPDVVSDPVVGVTASTTATADENAGRTRRSAVARSVRNFQSMARSCANALRARAVGRGREFGFFVDRCVVPHADAFSDYCGAWEQVWPRSPLCFQPKLQAFVIAGSTVLFWTGRTDDLAQRRSDGAILLSGYHLRMCFAGEEVAAAEEQNVQRTPKADDLLVRTGIGGKDCVYRRMSLPAIDSLERLQGDWSFSVPTLRLRIVGVLWMLEKRVGTSRSRIGSGFLTSHERHVMAGDIRLSWRRHRGQDDGTMCLVWELGGEQLVYPCTLRRRFSRS